MVVLDSSLAQKFIHKTANYFEYNINIMNYKGIIIASKDESRVGDFHEVAYNMLRGALDTGIVKEEQKYLGTKLGVNLFIEYKGENIGVIGVSGDPDTVKVFAHMLKNFLEAMIEYEMHMEWERLKKDKTEQFLYYLLFEEYIDLSKANSMAEELNIKKDLTRACLIIKNRSNITIERVINILMNTEGYSHQDIIIVARNSDIIVFKKIGEDIKHAIKNYKYDIEDYISKFVENIKEMNANEKLSFFVGTLQNNITRYKDSYNHANHLRLQIKEKKGIYFFNDYVIDYYRKLVNIKTYDEIYNIYNKAFTDDEKIVITETIEALKKNNYNIVNSSKELFIHRNTLLFRLNKLKNTLNIDPVANASDRDFLNEMAYYFNPK
ncbi:carbohydrate diacid regulator [Natranaerovirga hydrolytica]|uniref:Carbohydrate diacid regulator n=1 Tax=Natranaerovirga hydrolytica TaxID=680378 RepID=A0A4R1MJU5_9FIRM|nr:sugar diacid recognition domain-containing protein [Natranaerovirga hydrolytica]TCK92725.1 carbohydrate diacid regulator [Natranaerovirga hydrolytica]